MPEIKHNFTAGKMNKDLDERLIPNGQYKDAMNIQVSTSEGSDVGTVQNILGNSLVNVQDGIPAGTSCVGAIADEKNDKLYWFVSSSEHRAVNLVDTDGSTPKVINKNMILEYDKNTDLISPVFVDAIRIAISTFNGFDTSPSGATLDIVDPDGIEAGMSVYCYDSNVQILFSATVASVHATTNQPT